MLSLWFVSLDACFILNYKSSDGRGEGGRGGEGAETEEKGRTGGTQARNDVFEVSCFLLTGTVLLFLCL